MPKDPAQYDPDNNMSVQEAFNQKLRVISPYVRKTGERLFSKLEATQATAFLMHAAGFRQNKIADTLKISQALVSSYIQKAYREYPNLKRYFS